MNLFRTGFLATLFTATFFMFSCTGSSTETVEEVVEVAEGVSGTFSVSTDNSELRWTGSKVTGKHYGSINITAGEVTLENGLVAAANFIVDMTSLTVEDIEDPETNAMLHGHLLSDDFFDVSNFETATLVVTGSDNNTVSGELTIKGVSNPISFPVTVVEGEDGGAVLSGTMTVDRTLYGIRYGSGKFFENLGDKMINDQFTLDFVINL
jgi:polyisoprenoid-binding protein YceI